MTTTPNATQQLATYVAAKYPIIGIVSSEEQRVIQQVKAVAESREMGVRLWSRAIGFTDTKGGQQENILEPDEALSAVIKWSSRCIFVLRDFHPYIKNDNPANISIIRALRDFMPILRGTSKDTMKTIVLLCPELTLPVDLQADVPILRWPLPDRDEVGQALTEVCQVRNIQLENGARDRVVDAAMGMPLQAFQDSMARSLIGSKGQVIDPVIIQEGKKQNLEKTGALTWIDVKETLDDVGGLTEYKPWILQRKAAFTRKAREFGLPEPKGVVMIGPPGTGKSLSARATAAALELPLIRLDMGAVFGSLLGQSEENMRKVIDVAEACSPCVLWAEELEKAMAGMGGAGAASDAGVSSRLLGNFLTWMQEKTKPVFVFATANDVTQLPPELLRRGRFDELWFADLPNTSDRAQIWGVITRRYKRNPETLPISQLATITPGWTGAEIEAAFVDAMFAAFNESRDVTGEDIGAAIRRTVPLSKTAAEKIEAVRSWAKGRARPASTPDRTETGDRFSDLS